MTQRSGGRINVKVIVPADSKITDIAGLKGKKVSLGLENSDNMLTARQVLAHYGLTPQGIAAAVRQGR